MDLKFQMSEMPEDLRKIIVEYTMDHGPRPADDAILRFIGAAEMCGYKLVKQSPPVQSDEVAYQCVCGHKWHASMADTNCQSCNPSVDHIKQRVNDHGWNDKSPVSLSSLEYKALLRAAEQRVAGQSVSRAVDMLKGVLCNPEGKACVRGSDGDLSVIDDAIALLTAHREE